MRNRNVFLAIALALFAVAAVCGFGFFGVHASLAQCLGVDSLGLAALTAAQL